MLEKKKRIKQHGQEVFCYCCFGIFFGLVCLVGFFLFGFCVFGFFFFVYAVLLTYSTCSSVASSDSARGHFSCFKHHTFRHCIAVMSRAKSKTQ